MGKYNKIITCSIFAKQLNISGFEGFQAFEEADDDEEGEGEEEEEYEDDAVEAMDKEDAVVDTKAKLNEADEDDVDIIVGRVGVEQIGSGKAGQCVC